MKIIVLIGLCMLLIGCSSEICSLGWSNETHFCNEFHSYEKLPIKQNKTELELIYGDINEVNISEPFYNQVNLTMLSEPDYEPTLNMSQLFYKEEEVYWVYQIEIPIDEYTIRIVPCIMLKNESRYCEE